MMVTYTILTYTKPKRVIDFDLIPYNSIYCMKRILKLIYILSYYLLIQPAIVLYALSKLLSIHFTFENLILISLIINLLSEKIKIRRKKQYNGPIL